MTFFIFGTYYGFLHEVTQKGIKTNTEHNASSEFPKYSNQ